MGKRLVSRGAGIPFRQFRLFQKGRFGCADCTPGRPVSAREWLPILANIVVLFAHRAFQPNDALNLSYRGHRRFAGGRI
jgi:hypothetical protein